MSAVSKKNKLRNAAKKGISILLDKVDTALKRFEENERSDTSEILSLRDTLLEKIKKVEKLDDELMELLADVEDSNLEQEIIDEFTVIFKRKIFILNSNLNQADFHSEKSYSSTSKLIKLPRIEIKGFDGHQQS